MIRTAPLSQMILSDLNPRQTADPSDVEIMRRSIAAEGLLTPLLAYQTGEGAVAVVDGGTRLFALRMIHDADGGDPEIGYTLTSEADARRKAMAAQAVRRDLPPVAEMRAYQAAVNGGAEIAAIAASWGQTERYVKQRLALAALPDVIIAALEANEIPLYCADAFASAGDLAAEMWDEFGGKARRNPQVVPSQIRRTLDFSEANSRRAQLLDIVGAKAFIEAGGGIAQDLFSNAIRIENPDILEKLYSDHVGARAEAFAAEQGFKNWRFGGGEDPKGSVTVFAPHVGLTDDEQAREEELSEREDLSADEAAELRALYEKSTTREWPDDARDIVTLCVTERGAEMSGARGFVTKDRLEDAYAAGILDRPARAAAPDAGAAEEEGEGYSNAVLADLGNLPVDIMRDALTDKPELALNILGWALRCGAWKSPLSVSYDATPRSGLIAEDSAIGGWAADRPDFEISFADFLKQGKQHRNRVLAGLVATSLRRAALDQLAGHAPIRIRDAWTPDEAFLKRLGKPALVAIAEDIGAKDIKAERMKKAELVTALAAFFADPPKGLERKLNTWLPPALRPAQDTPAQDTPAQNGEADGEAAA